MKKILFAFAVFIILLFGTAVGYYVLFPQRSSSAELRFSGPPRALVGEPFPVEASFTNAGDRRMVNAKLFLTAPEGAVFVGKSPSLRVLEIAIGNVAAGNEYKETFRLLALDGTNTVKHMEGKLRYTLDSGSRAQFEAPGSIDVPIGSSAISLNFAAPQRVFSGESFEFGVEYENNSEYPYDRLTVKMEYPPVFQFVSSSLAASRSNNTWVVGGLAQGKRGSVQIRGNVVGPEQSFFGFRGSILADIGGQIYAITTQDASVAISTPPLSVKVTIGEHPSYIAKAGELLDYRFVYRNNSDVAMENVTLTAAFTGEMFDFATAKTTGFFNSITNTFLWNAANTAELRSVAPGQSGAVQLTVGLKNAFPIKRISDKNFNLKTRAQIESPTVPEATGASKTVSVASIDVPMAGFIEVLSRGYFRDAASGILNTGVFPPRVNQPTQYTVHWIIRNHSTDVKNVLVSANLQSNTRFTGQMKSSLGVQPSFNPASGEVSWKIAALPATKGIVGEPIEIIFQLENVPAVNEEDQLVTILSKTRIQAEDTYTGTRLEGSAPVVSSAIPDDLTITDLQHLVQP